MGGQAGFGELSSHSNSGLTFCFTHWEGKEGSKGN